MVLAPECRPAAAPSQQIRADWGFHQNSNRPVMGLWIPQHLLAHYQRLGYQVGIPGRQPVPAPEVPEIPQHILAYYQRLGYQVAIPGRQPEPAPEVPEIPQHLQAYYQRLGYQVAIPARQPEPAPEVPVQFIDDEEPELDR